MSSEIFERNWNCLAKRYPDYAAALRTLPSFPVPSLDPAPVRSWLKQVVEAKTRQAILMGLGGGYAASILHGEFPFHFLVILENTLANLAAALHTVDLCAALEDECVHWIVACPPSRLETGLLNVKSRLAAHGFQAIRTPSADPAERAYYDAVLKELPGIVERESFSLKALLARGTGVQINLVRNLPAVLDSFPPDAIVGRFAGKPAVIAAAGPSLDKNVRSLCSLQNRAVLIAVDTALKTLLPLGIEPHFAVTTDPTPAKACHFREVILPEETVFAFAPDGCPEIVEPFRRHPRKLVLFDNSNWYNEYLRRYLGLNCLLPRAMHVGEAAIRLAIAMGCDPIVLAGFDLALPPDSQATHAKASARALPILAFENNRARVRGEDGQTHTQDLHPVPGVDGRPVLTYYSFKMYLEDLARLVAETPVRWIDATEGGALKPGCAIQSLADTLSSFQETLEISRHLEAMSKPSPSTVAFCLGKLRDGFQRLETLQADLIRLIEGRCPLDEAALLWKTLLDDKEIRAFLDHAIYPFQLQPKISKIPPEERMEFLNARAREALQTVRVFLVFWKDALQRCEEKEPHT